LEIANESFKLLGRMLVKNVYITLASIVALEDGPYHAATAVTVLSREMVSEELLLEKELVALDNP
jgi:hypothetical protein